MDSFTTKVWEEFPKEVQEIIDLRKYRDSYVVPHMSRKNLSKDLIASIASIISADSVEDVVKKLNEDMNASKCTEPFELSKIEIIKTKNCVGISILHVCKKCECVEHRTMKIHIYKENIYQLVKEELNP